MEQWNRIRQRVLRDGISIRQIQRETGLHHTTIKKILASSSPPSFACPARAKTKLGPYVERIAAILQAEWDEYHFLFPGRAFHVILSWRFARLSNPSYGIRVWTSR